MQAKCAYCSQARLPKLVLFPLLNPRKKHPINRYAIKGATGEDEYAYYENTILKALPDALEISVTCLHLLEDSKYSHF